MVRTARVLSSALLSSALMCCLMVGCLGYQGPKLGHKEAALEGSALDFELPRLGSQTPYRLSSDRGNVVLLDVWATWCGACRESLPLYTEFLAQYGPRGFRSYAINIDVDRKMVDAFVKQDNIRLPVLLDPEGLLVESKLKVKMIPTAFLVDRRGAIRFAHEGFEESMIDGWIHEIEMLLAEAQP